MEAVLTVATILGGIAAIWYFWDKIVEWWRPKHPVPTPAPIQPQPAPPATREKWVDFRYPRDSGLQARLEAAGFRVTWSMDRELARRTDLEGWEIVLEPDTDGVPTRFRLKDRPDNQTLIKKRQ